RFPSRSPLSCQAPHWQPLHLRQNPVPSAAPPRPLGSPAKCQSAPASPSPSDNHTPPAAFRQVAPPPTPQLPVRSCHSSCAPIPPDSHSSREAPPCRASLHDECRHPLRGFQQFRIFSND